MAFVAESESIDKGTTCLSLYILKGLPKILKNVSESSTVISNFNSRLNSIFWQNSNTGQLENIFFSIKLNFKDNLQSQLFAQRILVKNEGEYIQIKIYVYGVTNNGASGGVNIENFRPPLNRENHEKLAKIVKNGNFLLIIFRLHAAPLQYSYFQNLEVFLIPKIPKSDREKVGFLCTTRLKNW